MESREIPGLDREFSRQMKELLGAEISEFLDVLEAEPPTSVLMNAFRNPGPDLFPSDAVPWCPYGRYLHTRPTFTFDPLFHAGCYYVMEASSMFLYHAVKEIAGKKPLRVLDLCAAPGGKSVVTLDALPEMSFLVSNEVNQSRFQILQYNLDKWGRSNAARISMDPSRIPWEGKFDLIIIDAPCSGEGLFRKDKDARAEWSEEHVRHCSLRQKRILSDAVRLLSPDGYVIYSTCTYNADENINQVHWMTQQYGFHSVSIEIDPQWNIAGVKMGGAIGYQFYPHKVRGEGFFCAVMQKKESGEKEEDGISQKRQQKKKDTRKQRKDEVPSWLKKWIDPGIADDVNFFQKKNGEYHALKSPFANSFLKESSALTGTRIGEGAEGAFSPSHALALSELLNPEMPSVDLDERQALSFLRKDSLSAEARPGWNIARYRGYALGWLKQTQSGLKNYLPTKYRIIKAG